jgi:vacuolar-type H+-ATPase subunit E/Vma4
MKMEGQMGVTYRSLSSNPLRNVKYPYIAQAAGCSRLALEKDAMKQAGSYRLGSQVATQYLLRQLAEDKVQALGEQQAQEFIHQVGLGNLAKVYVRDPQGRPYIVSVDTFAKSPRTSLPGILADYEEKAVAVAKKSMGQLTLTEVKRFHQALVERVEILLNASEGGLLQAPAFLTALNYQLSQQQQRVQQQLNRAEEDLEIWHQEQQERHQNRLKRITANMRKALLTRAQQKIELRLRIMKLLAQQELQMAIQQIVEQLLQALARWVSAIEHLSQELMTQHDLFNLDREIERPVCVLNVLNTEEEDRILAEHIEAAWVEAIQGLSFRWQAGRFVLFCKHTNAAISNPQSLWEEAGIEAFVGYASSFFDGLEKLSIESLIEALALTPIMGDHKTNKPERILQWMANKAAPLIKLDDVKQQEDVYAITIFASEKGASGYFQAAASHSNWKCVASNDPFNVELLISWHHINPWALQTMPLMQEAYDALKHKETLHVFEEWHDQIEAEPSNLEILEQPSVNDDADYSYVEWFRILGGK